MNLVAQPQTPASNADFYSGALRRIRILMIVLAGAFTAGAFVRYGWHTALGFACGSAVAYLNFHWLKRGVAGLADRLTETPDEATATGSANPPTGSKGVFLKFVLRYVLMGLAAYGILTVSPASLYGLLAGLFLPVAAIACEAAYEAYVALSRGI